jgi:hypothetical protein
VGSLKLVLNWALDPKIEIIREIAHFVDKRLIRKITDFWGKAILGPFAVDPCNGSENAIFSAMPIFGANPAAAARGSAIGPFQWAIDYKQSRAELPINHCFYVYP